MRTTPVNVKELEARFNRLLRDRKLWCFWNDDTRQLECCVWRSPPSPDDRDIMIGALMFCCARDVLH